MIARTKIDPLAIREAVETSHDGGVEILTRLATELRRHGAICFDHTDAELRAAIDPRAVKPAVAKLWEALLADLRRWGRIIDDHGPVNQGLHLDLHVVGRHTVQPRSGQATAEDADRSTAIQRLRALKYAENYKEGTDSARVWAERLAPCARISERVTIVDKYLFGSKERGLNPYLVPWLLDQLKQNAGPRLLVELIGDSPGADGVNRVRELLSDCTPRPIQVQVWIAPWKWTVPAPYPGSQARRRSGPHNRHIMFSCNAAFTMEEGLDRLVEYRGRPRVSGASGVTPHFVPAGDPQLARLKKIEDELKAATPQSTTFRA